MATRKTAKAPNFVSHFPVRATWNFAAKGKKLKSLKGRWRVPSPPSKDNNQTVFLFIGIQTARAADGKKSILQPVLLWNKQMGGWFVSCVYVSGKPGNLRVGVRTKAIPVAPNDVLDATITLAAPNDNGAFGYNCEFNGLAGSGVYIGTRERLVEAGVALEVALEAGKKPDPSDFPTSPVTQFEDLEITYEDDSKAKPSWKIKTKFGVRAKKIAHGGIENEIDILYR